LWSPAGREGTPQKRDFASLNRRSITKYKNNMTEKDKICQIAMWGGISCGRELYDDEYCIFHSPKADKDAKLFQNRLNEIFEEKAFGIYDFTKFVFPDNVLFPYKIDRKIIFCGATFQGSTLFYKTVFQDEADFQRATFQGGTRFHAIFKKRADFREATFRGDAYFWGEAFEELADFTKVTFEGKADFTDIVFKDARFLGAVFQKDASFEGATFKGRSDFSGVTFMGLITFNSATFEDALIVDQESKDEIFSEKVVDFRSVRFLKPEMVRFRKVKLSKFRFLETDLRKVEFVSVSWEKRKRSKRAMKRKYRGVNWIYDEIEPGPQQKEKFDYLLIAQVYKRLRANYEENLNYAEAGDFHIGEMECKRKSYKTWLGRNIGLTALYKYVSNYGEGYRRNFYFWILPILLLFPILFMYSGIEGVTQSQTPYLSDYNFDASSISLNKAGDWAKDYLKSFVYSLSVFSLVREKQYRPIDTWGHFWMVLESILSPVLIAFFLLALRRRFRR
jgi:uncharacterized protein YjbI with pentapeptide repeats